MSFDFSRFKGVIFDLDGTLVRSSHVWSKIDNDFLAKRGFEVPHDYTEKIACLNFREGALYTIERFGLSESPDEIIAEWYDMAKQEYSSSVKLIDGAEKLILRLKNKGIKIGLATASNEGLYTAALKSNGVYDYFDAFASSEEVCRSKEFPDVYILAAGKLNCPVGECAVFEDVPKCAEAARSAGFFTFGQSDDRGLMKYCCDVCYYSFRELL